MNLEYVIDTMAIILKLEKRKLPEKIKTIFNSVENGESGLIIPVMVLLEIGYLSEKKRIDIDLVDVYGYCNQYPGVRIKEISVETIKNTFKISDIPELHDRIIAGVAFELGLELITNDPIIGNSNYIKTIWK
jgi:predicted nucleic acid-binding protein